eukprot:TRINITY_DN41404_c0_g1_i1.p1 TRINITY_DN41404_c0_g1~~TRINITY_DN41404_c0_g1_i1.p1  ORF type:complete len:343 (-),score=37.32 TRINITY_DN41404_c0_g1_i1:64-1092(-)
MIIFIYILNSETAAMSASMSLPPGSLSCPPAPEARFLAQAVAGSAPLGSPDRLSTQPPNEPVAALAASPSPIAEVRTPKLGQRMRNVPPLPLRSPTDTIAGDGSSLVYSAACSSSLLDGPASDDFISNVDWEGEMMRRRLETELRELQGVVAMKDSIIRSLGARLGAAEATVGVVRAKDEIIRGLGEELVSKTRELEAWRVDAQRAATRAASDVETLPCSNADSTGTQCIGLSRSASFSLQQQVDFTVLPEASGQYTPVPGDDVDERIAAFFNRVPCSVLLTRLSFGQYLYGRLAVSCACDSCDDGVRVFNEGAGQAWPISEFICLHEGPEYEYCLSLYVSP